jgi:hypothetical protein
MSKEDKNVNGHTGGRQDVNVCHQTIAEKIKGPGARPRIYK